MALQPGYCPACGSQNRFKRNGCPHAWHQPPEEAELYSEAARQIREEATAPITDQHKWNDLVAERFAELRQV
jgi:hypothetical protein